MRAGQWIALIILMLCLAYGWAAFFTMDEQLPPIMRRSPVWPSSFPKLLAVGATVLALVVLFAPQRPSAPADVILSRSGAARIAHALGMVALMVVYALTLRPLGFLLTTFLFLFLGSALLGERRLVLMVGVAAMVTGGVWSLVDPLLGIFLRPLPVFPVGV